MNTVWTLGDYATERRIEVPGEEKNYTVRFSTVNAMIRAAEQLIGLFEQWEKQQLFCPDIDRNSFLFDSKTGDLTFPRNQSVIRMEIELSEEQRVQFYSAPELILGQVTTAAAQTQNWTLAMLLFDLFYHGGHPLSGACSHSQIFLCPQDEYRWYAKDGTFNMSATADGNRPVYGIQGHLLRYWDYYPNVLQEAFTKVFQTGKEDPASRLTTKQWKQVLNDLKCQIPCDCGYGGFIRTYPKTANGNYSCPRCGKIYYALESENHRVYISHGSRLRGYQMDPDQPDDDSIVAIVVENKQRKGVYGIKNMTDTVWNVKFPDQVEREVARNQGAPIWRGLMITMPNGTKWCIQPPKTQDTKPLAEV